MTLQRASLALISAYEVITDAHPELVEYHFALAFQRLGDGTLLVTALDLDSGKTIFVDRTR